VEQKTLKIELQQIANDPASEVSSMVGELEGVTVEKLDVNLQWPIRFISAGAKTAPHRWPTRFGASGEKTAPPRWGTRFIAAGPKSAPTKD
jgi:hypothetical protein